MRSFCTVFHYLATQYSSIIQMSTTDNAKNDIDLTVYNTNQNIKRIVSYFYLRIYF